jgi:hypothetical protein
MIGDALLKDTITISSYGNQIACVFTRCSSTTSLSRHREQDARERLIEQHLVTNLNVKNELLVLELSLPDFQYPILEVVFPNHELFRLDKLNTLLSCVIHNNSP